MELYEIGRAFQSFLLQDFSYLKRTWVVFRFLESHVARVGLELYSVDKTGLEPLNLLLPHQHLQYRLYHQSLACVLK